MSDVTASSAGVWPGPNDLLSREELSRALTLRGMPIAAATLATMKTRGGGPPVTHWGRKPLYEWQLALDWACSRLTKANDRPARRLASDSDFTAQGRDLVAVGVERP
jgi:hypothetical protein